MTNLIPTASLDNVPQLERTTVALGGPGAPMNTQAQALLNRTQYILGQITGFSGDIAALQANVTSLNTNVSTINGQIATINGQVSTLDGQVSTLNSEVATNTANIATNTSNISSNTASITSNTSGIATINSGLGAPAGFTQVGMGSVLRSYLSKNQDVVNAKDFGSVGDGITDDTAHLQNAINSTPDGAILSFPRTGNTYSTSDLSIAKNIRIELNGAKFIMTGSRVFALSANVDFCEIVGCGGVNVNQSPGTLSTREFFSDWTLVNQIDYSNISSGTKYTTQRLLIERNITNAAKITVVGSHKSIYIRENTALTSSSDPSPLPYFLLVSPGDNPPARVYGDFVVSDNYWDVFTATNTPGFADFYDGNYDIVKISRAVSGVKLKNNFVRNNNPGQTCAQMDVFTGAHLLSSSGNTYINVQLHRKQLVGAVPTPDFGLDTYVDDTWVIQTGFSVMYVTASQTRNNPIYFHGARAQFIGCNVLNEYDYPMSVFFLPNFTTVYPGFGIKGTTHLTVNGGMFDLRSDATINDSCVIHGGADVADEADQYVKMIGCNVIGGVKLVREVTAGCMFRYMQTVGVTWTNGGVGTGTDIDYDFTYPHATAGNIFDNAYRLPSVNDVTNKKSGFVTVTSPSTITFSVNAYNSIRFDGTGTLTGLDNGVIGQRVAINKINLSGTANHGTSAGNLSLAGQIPFGMISGSVLIVELGIDAIWHEVSRVDSRRKLGTTAQRPSFFASGETYTYWDTTIGKPVFWNGSGWRDATGATA